tara:strand:+ start:478 stop:1242 length:765 start_codon:yes stop_codon:yes gene_type:complete
MNLLKKYQKSTHKSNYDSSYFSIQNALDSQEYNEILENYPDQQTCKKYYISKIGNPKNDPNRYDIFTEDIISNDFFHQSLRSFVKESTSKKFIHKLVDIFDLDARFKKLKINIGEIENPKSSEYIVSCANVGVNFPRKEKPRGIHIDLQSSMVVGLFYVRRKDDDSSGGDLDIFSYKNENIRKKYHKLGRNVFNKDFKNKSQHEDLVKIDTIKYQENTCVFFKNNMDAIHAVTDRQNAKVQRNLINIYFSFLSQ